MQDIILFDVGNVIVRASHRITHQILERKGINHENAVKFFQNPEYGDFSRGKITGRQFHRALTDKYLGEKLSYDDVMGAHNAHLYNIDEEVVDVLNGLDRRRLAFVTDTNEWQTAKERELIDLRNYSNRIFRSHEMGMLKTDEDCFPYVIAQLDIAPGRITLVDDSVGKIQMAKKFGIKTILFSEGMDLMSRLGN